MRRICVLLAAAVMAAAMSAVSAEPRLAAAIEAVVHNAVITSYEIDMNVLPAAQELSRQYQGQPQEFAKRLDEIRADNRDRLVENQLILHEFETAGYRLPDALIDEQFQGHIRANYGNDRVLLIRTLQAQGKTVEQARKDFRDRFIIQQMRYSRTAGEIIVSPHKIETYYETHQDRFKQKEQAKLRVIVVNKSAGDTGEANARAAEILARIKEGASFAEMARQYSQGAHSSRGGDWDWYEKSVLRKELDEVAFSLQPGETSGVIDTPEASYLLLVEDRRPAQVRPLKEVRPEIEQTLLAQERDRLQKQWIERLKKKTFVRYF